MTECDQHQSSDQDWRGRTQRAFFGHRPVSEPNGLCDRRVRQFVGLQFEQDHDVRVEPLFEASPVDDPVKPRRHIGQLPNRLFEAYHSVFPHAGAEDPGPEWSASSPNGCGFVWREKFSGRIYLRARSSVG